MYNFISFPISYPFTNVHVQISSQLEGWVAVDQVPGEIR